MRFKTTYILFGVLAAGLVLFGAMLSWKKSVDKEGFVFPSFHDKDKPAKIDDIDRVEIEVQRDRDGARDDQLVFVRQDQNWRLEKPAVRVEGTLVSQLIHQLVSARKDENADLSPNLQSFGLEPPAAKVTLIDSKGDHKWTLAIGNESIGGTNALVYATSSERGEGKEPLAIPREQIEALFKVQREAASSDSKSAVGPAPPVLKSVNDFRSRTLLADNALNIVEVSLQEPKHDAVVLKKDTSDGRWRFLKPAGYGDADDEPMMTPFGQEAPHQGGVRGLLAAIAALRVQDNADFKGVDVSDADLAQKGLAKDNYATMRLEVERSAGGFHGREDDQNKTVTDVLLIGKKADDKGEKYYARLAGEKYIVLVNAKDLKPIQEAIAKPQTLRNHNLIHVNRQEVDAIDLEPSRGVVLKLRRSGGIWRLFEGGAKGADADRNSIQSLINALATPRLVRDFPTKTDTEAGLNDPSAVVVKLWVNGVEKSDEKPDAEPALKDKNKPTVELTFGKKDGDKLYVRRKTEGGDTTLVEVPASVLTTVLGGKTDAKDVKLAYLDRTLPSFAAEDVRKLVIVRDGETYEVDKDEKAEKPQAVWKIKQPSKPAGRDANPLVVEAILSTLRNLRPDKLERDKVNTESELDKYGLKKPSGTDQKSFIQVTVTLQGEKNPERVYHFGIKDGTVYGWLKQDERGLVFTTRNEMLDVLRTELRDPTVLSFVPDNVAEIKFTWKNPKRAQPTILDLKRTPDGRAWKETDAKPLLAAIDDRKVEDLLSALATLTTHKFVEGELKPDDKLGLLEIEILLKENKTPLTLTLGASGDEGYLLARGGKIPKTEGFLLPKQLFKDDLRAGPDYFGK
jgi:hypothetical protein